MVHDFRNNRIPKQFRKILLQEIGISSSKNNSYSDAIYEDDKLLNNSKILQNKKQKTKKSSIKKRKIKVKVSK